MHLLVHTAGTRLRLRDLQGSNQHAMLSVQRSPESSMRRFFVRLNVLLAVTMHVFVLLHCQCSAMPGIAQQVADPA